MKSKKSISLLVLFIAVLSLAVSAYSFFAKEGPGASQFTSLDGQTVSIYGQGVYKNESVAMAAQAKGQDFVTMALGVPLLLVSLYLARRNSLKGRLLLTGTLAYFLYTYVSYVFLAMYNSFFLAYIFLMMTSFFAFILAMMSFDLTELSTSFNEKLPVKFIGGFLLFSGVAVGLMWIGRIVPPLMDGTVPVILEHYTTLVIQGLDLGIVIPAQILAAILLIRRKPFGYLLASVITIKVITLLTAMSAMIIGQAMVGVEMGVVELAMFPLFNLIAIICLVLILRNINEQGSNKIASNKKGLNF